MYKILIKAEPKCPPKPRNPLDGYFHSNFDGWMFYKENGREFNTPFKELAVEKYEQIIYTIPAKNVKLIDDIDTIVDYDFKPECWFVDFTEQLEDTDECPLNDRNFQTCIPGEEQSCGDELIHIPEQPVPVTPKPGLKPECQKTRPIPVVVIN